LRSREASQAAGPFLPLLTKEIGDLLAGRGLWTMLLLLAPLVGYSFLDSVALYGEASRAALKSPALARGLSPLDGVLVPTMGSFYVALTLLFPFVAIRLIGREKEQGALELLLQLPYATATLGLAKLLAVGAALALTAVPVLSALVAWVLMGGHVGLTETFCLLLGHSLYGLLVGAIGLFAAAVTDSAATAAIVALSFTIGSWVLDFGALGQGGLPGLVAQLSLTQTVRPFEQGLLSLALVFGMTATVLGLTALAVIWLPPGVPFRVKLLRSVAAALVIAATLAAAGRAHLYVDVAEDRRNSFAVADERLLRSLGGGLDVIVRLAPEDPRFMDLQRSVLAKLERTVPHVTVRLAAESRDIFGGGADAAYGEVEYTYRGRSAVSRSTSPEEVLPLVYGLAGLAPPAPDSGADYPGYPLQADAGAFRIWFYAVLPALIVVAWWWTSRPRRRRGLATATEERHAET
jgi:ABC-2 type transport system permease protein